MLPTLQDVKKAQERIKGVTHETPLEHSEYFSKICHNKIYFKLENLQFTGSFKLRGAYNKISTLPHNIKGVVTASAGNHAQGVALSAHKKGIKAVVVMPESASIIKIQRTQSYGAQVILHGKNFGEALQKALQLEKEKGYTLVHAYDDKDVISGQGTIGLEILEHLPETDAIIVPVGGGGLISGIAIAAKSLNPKIKIIGVQAKGAPSMYESLKQNRIVEIMDVHTIADGIAVKKPSKLTFEITKKFVDKVITVNDDEINAALLSLLENSKLVAEPAGVVGLAALMHKKGGLKNKKAVVVISGGNIDMTRMDEIIQKGLVKLGRKIRFKTMLEDKPGELLKLVNIFADKKANIVFIHHDRMKSRIGTAGLEIALETRDKHHIKEVLDELKNCGYKIELD